MTLVRRVDHAHGQPAADEREQRLYLDGAQWVGGVVSLDDRHCSGERIRLVQHGVRTPDGHLVGGPRLEHVAEIHDRRDAPRVRIGTVDEDVVVVGVVIDDTRAETGREV